MEEGSVFCDFVRTSSIQCYHSKIKFFPMVESSLFIKRGNCKNCAVPPRISAVLFLNLCSKSFEQLLKT